MKINYNELTIKQINELLKNKKITPSELINFSYEQLKKYQILNAIVTNLHDSAVKKSKELDNKKNNNLLFAIPYATKDNIATINHRTTGSCAILDNFVPYYDSTVNSLLTNSNAINLAKTALDELGMGGDGLYAHTGIVHNPWNKDYITGGSSSGSAALVASKVANFALGTDTGDSIRKPAAYCGIVGFKPTYGLISRNGVFPYAPSLDTVGVFSNHVEDVAVILDNIIKEDKNDFTSFKSLEKDYADNLKNDVKNLKIAVLNYQEYSWNNNVKSAFDNAINELKNGGALIDYINFDKDLLNSLLPVYMMISFAEATSCHANLSGINFGVRKLGASYHDTMVKTRTAGFGNVVKRRYILGSYVLSEKHQSELFVKAKKVRRLIVNKLNELFKNYDAFIVMPTVNHAPKIDDVLNKKQLIRSEHKYMEDLLLLANLSGCPSITIPLTLDNNLPIAININSNCFKDQTTLNIANFLSKKINFKNNVGVDNE